MIWTSSPNSLPQWLLLLRLQGVPKPQPGMQFTPWSGPDSDLPSLIIRKIAKRVDDLLTESAALREDTIPQLAALADAGTKAVDFGIQFGQRIGAYITEIRTAKSPFQLSVVLAAAREISGAVIPSKDLSSWASVKNVIQTLGRDAVAFLPAAMEADHVVKSMLRFCRTFTSL